MNIRPVVAIFLALGLAASSVFGESIMLISGIFTPDFSGCHPRTMFTNEGLGVGGFWIMARLNNFADTGVSGFSCYIEGLDGLPPFWSVQVDAASAGVISGDFVGYRFVSYDKYERGGSLTFSTCQVGMVVPLLRVRLVGVGVTEDVPTNTRVGLVHAMPWESVDLACPLLTVCDSGAFTKICVEADELVFNAEPPICPPSPVHETTWSEVKELYRAR